MKQLHDEQILEQSINQRLEQQDDLITSSLEYQNEKESEIEKGNLLDYLEIFGEDNDI